MINKEDFISRLKYALSKNKTKKQFALRNYQVNVAYEAVCNLSAHENVVINLPTGTGKTLISNYISIYWKKCPLPLSRNRKKVEIFKLGLKLRRA